MSDEHRDALARVIDPESWELYDDKRVKTDSIRDAIVSESRDMASRIIDSGLMAKLEWDSREYRNAQKSLMERTSKKGKCYEIDGFLDGPILHDPKCIHWMQAGMGIGSSCIR